VKGWVKIHSYTDPAEKIFQFDRWSLESNATSRAATEITVAEHRQHGKGFVARIKGIDDRTAAEAICQRAIAVSADTLPELPEGEYYWQQLIGLHVVSNQEGAQKILLGEISSMLETGANDVMVVSPCDGSIDQRERLLPYVDVYILQVDLENKQMLVDWDPEF
jgi:16S rRNA processing protein RimM